MEGCLFLQHLGGLVGETPSERRSRRRSRRRRRRELRGCGTEDAQVEPLHQRERERERESGHFTHVLSSHGTSARLLSAPIPAGTSACPPTGQRGLKISWLDKTCLL
ncbi:hypothetical protein OJAV_G00133880 [Oryzias javanicus]|uniref:Uncharacterized protein n=1 Tax=Oryzias javanicus TaxID=123683 RepID=A0A437CQY4_ORYJA|nr:hypothetical protein OJAV_G00133880 [Oryzias javanicus]